MRTMRTAILFAAFGTTQPEPLEDFEGFLKRAQEVLRGVGVFSSFVSPTVQRHHGMEGLLTTFGQIHDAGYTRVVVQPLLIVPGAVYTAVLNFCAALTTLRDIRGNPLFAEMLFGRALLGTPEDQKAVVAAFTPLVAPHLKDRGTAIVFVGHGSREGESAYREFDRLVTRAFGPQSGVVVLEGSPNLAELLPRLRKIAQRVILWPLMFFTGHHFKKDIAEGRGSLRERLREEGFTVEVLPRGLLQEETFVRMLWERVEELLTHAGTGH